MSINLTNKNVSYTQIINFDKERSTNGDQTIAERDGKSHPDA